MAVDLPDSPPWLEMAAGEEGSWFTGSENLFEIYLGGCREKEKGQNHFLLHCL